MINKKALSQARKAVESLYDAKCTVIEYKNVTNEVTKQTKKQEVSEIIDQPCKLSFSSLKNSSQTDAGNEVKQVIKVFIAPELEINPGSKLVITNKGRTTDFKNSGKPAIFNTHQEIVLELFTGWA